MSDASFLSFSLGAILVIALVIFLVVVNIIFFIKLWKMTNNVEDILEILKRSKKEETNTHQNTETK